VASYEAAAELAEQILGVLQRHGVDAVVIGGVALAAHNHPRATDDLDLGVNATRATLRTFAMSSCSRATRWSFGNRTATTRWAGPST